MISSKKISLIAILLVALVLIGTVYAMLLPSESLTGNVTGVTVYGDNHQISIADDDYYTNYADGTIVKVSLNGETAEAKSNNVEIADGDVKILAGGVYILSGSLSDGSVIVDSGDGAEVRIVLNGVNITSSDFSAIYVKQAEKTVISLAPNTENVLTDASSYNEEKTEDGKPSACLYSKDDLTINGTGKLTINGNYADGIKANDVLKITEADIEVNAVDEGINANDYIAAIDANIDITSGGDAVRCEHEDSGKGFIVCESAALTVTSGGDGIYASSALYLNDTTAQITSGGGSENASKSGSGFDGGGQGGMGGGFGGMRSGMDGGFDGGQGSETDDTASTKAIKAGTNIVINGGSFNLNSSDDSLHSDGDLSIEGGTFTISAGDDAVHAEANLTVNPESMNITKCYEGLEGAYITINGGDIDIVSDDDGINASGSGNSGMGMMRGGMDGEEKTSEDDIWVTVNGGHIRIETSGDGLDSNASAAINGGYLEIYGPENSGNGSIDVGDGGYVLIMNGGTLLAAGSSGMAEQPSESSPQQSLVFYLDETYQAGSAIQVTDSSGNEIISGTSSKSFDWICVSAETLVENETYTLLIDGNAVSEITANGSLAAAGSASGGMNGGMGNMDGMGRRK